MVKIDTRLRWPLYRLDALLDPDEIALNDGEIILLRAGLIHLAANLPETPMKLAMKGILAKVEAALLKELQLGSFSELKDKEV